MNKMSTKEIQFKYKDITIKFEWYNDNDNQKWRWNNKFYEDKLLEKLKSFNLTGTYIDVGAHLGNHTIFFDKFCNSEKVISIEGSPYTFEYTLKNAKTNNLTKTNIYNYIVSDKDNEMIEIGLDHINNCGQMSIYGKHKYYKSVVKSITLDTLLKDEDKISLIKIDVENSEYNVLLGAIDIIEKHKPIIIIELHKTNPYYNEILHFLEKNNYKSDNINYAISPTFIYKYCS